MIDVEIRNCVLEGADQAIVIARGGSHTIAGNTVAHTIPARRCATSTARRSN